MNRVMVVLGSLGTVTVVTFVVLRLVWFSSNPAVLESLPPPQTVESTRSITSATLVRQPVRDMTQTGQALAPLQAKLLGTAVERDPKASRAFVRETLTKQQVTLALGQGLQGRVLSHIARGFVRLRRPDGTEELLTIESTTSADAIIQARGADEYQVDKRRLVNAIKGDVRALWAQGRLTPHLEQFQLAGFELSEVQPDSFIEQAGLKPHDIITSVNGKPLTSLPAALAVYDSARHSHDIAVELKRQGDHHTLRYFIREDPPVIR